MTESILSLACFGVLGFGEHAKTLLGSFARCDRSRLTHIGTEHPEKTDFVRRKHPHIRVCRSYSEVLDRSDVAVVVITLPNHLHEQWIEYALDAGKHVICEKPLCLDGASANRLAAKAHAKSLLLAEAFYYRQHVQHKLVRTILSDGELGEIISLDVKYQYAIEDESNFRLDAERGGGVLNDVGCYGVDSSRFYFGSEPSAAKGTLSLDGEGVDRRSELELTFAGGRAAHISCSMDGKRESSLKIHCEKGSVSIPHAFHVQAAQKVTIALHRHGETAEILPQHPCDQYAELFDLFAAAVLDRTALPFPLENGVKNIETLDLIRAECRRV